MNKTTENAEEIEIGQGDIQETTVSESRSLLGNPMFDTLLNIGLIVIVFYFVLILPQRKKDKEKKEMLSSIKNGDKVVTNSGIFGKIINFTSDGDRVSIEISENVIIQVLKSAISEIIKDKKNNANPKSISHKKKRIR